MLNILLIAAISPQVQDAEARHTAYRAASIGIAADFTVTEPTVGVVGRGRIEVQNPNKQKFTLKWQDQDFEFRHSRDGGISIRHDWREYHATSGFLFNPHPSPLMSGLAEIGYPALMVSPTLQDYSRGVAWEHQGTQTIRGSKCDKLFVDLSDRQATGRHTVWIDSQGKILRWRREMATTSGRLDIQMNFSNHTQSPPSDLRHYDMTLPIGFVPTQLPNPRTRTIQVAQMAVFGDWMNVRKNEHDDVARLVDGFPVVIVFTDPDCEISGQIEPYLVSLRERLIKEECALIEVSLGRKKPNVSGKDAERRVYWDQLGSIEKAYGTPGTPYFLLANKDGQLVRGWQGYSKKTESEITKELLRAFAD